MPRDLGERKLGTTRFQPSSGTLYLVTACRGPSEKYGSKGDRRVTAVARGTTRSQINRPPERRHSDVAKILPLSQCTV